LSRGHGCDPAQSFVNVLEAPIGALVTEDSSWIHVIVKDGSPALITVAVVRGRFADGETNPPLSFDQRPGRAFPPLSSTAD
jgi:hypothetical protein